MVASMERFAPQHQSSNEIFRRVVALCGTVMVTAALAGLVILAVAWGILLLRLIVTVCGIRF